MDDGDDGKKNFFHQVISLPYFSHYIIEYKINDLMEFLSSNEKRISQQHCVSLFNILHCTVYTHLDTIHFVAYTRNMRCRVVHNSVLHSI